MHELSDAELGVALRDLDLDRFNAPTSVRNVKERMRWGSVRGRRHVPGVAFPAIRNVLEEQRTRCVLYRFPLDPDLAAAGETVHPRNPAGRADPGDASTVGKTEPPASAREVWDGSPGPPDADRSYL
jgi:hypothetical protein